MIPLPKIAELLLTPGQVVGLVALVLFALANVRAGRRWYHLPSWEHAFGLVGLSLVIDGQYMGLVDAPPERMMGNVGRIMYAHVPSAWLTMLTFFLTTFVAVAHLVTGKRQLDALVVAGVEVGIVFSIILQCTGMLFAKPTWGTYWDWDPRLVSTAVMSMSYAGVLSLRSVLDDPEQRATWSSVTAILASVSMGVTYMSVQWWRTLHQIQSNPETVGITIKLVLRLNAWAWLFLAIWFTARRWRIAMAESDREQAPALPDEVTA